MNNIKVPQMIINQDNIPQGLSSIAGKRDLITVRELAQVLSRSEQTIRKLHCVNGEVYGIRLKKIGGRLMASVAETAAVMNGCQQQAARTVVTLDTHQTGGKA